MTVTTLGYISLNISFILYLIFYLPQLLHNHLYKSIEQLSLTMHIILYTAAIADLMYGLASAMQWQYVTVAVVSLASLTVQHIQITIKQGKKILLHTFYLLGLLCYAFYCIEINFVSTMYITITGFISQLSGFYCIPQIIKNNQLKSTAGISFYFVLLGGLVNLCDTISAWALNWNLPSKIGAPLSIMFNLILLHQFIKYATPKLSPALEH